MVVSLPSGVVGKFSNAKVDRAAGGVLFDVVDGVGCAAVVHRPRYDDWSLPKGHVDAGETWRETAVREVLEETGFVADIVGEPSAVAYMLYDTVPKIVVFYPMLRSSSQTPATSEVSEVDVSEVDAVEWWPIDRASVELTYSVERAIVAELAPKRSGSGLGEVR